MKFPTATNDYTSAETYQKAERIQELSRRLEIDLVEFFMVHMHLPGPPTLEQARAAIGPMVTRALERARAA